MKAFRYILATIMIGTSLFLGFVIYVETRVDYLPVNRWSEGLSFHFSESNRILTEWIIYSLPDALWMFALSTSVLLVWKFQWNKHCIGWYFIALLLGATFECLQAVHLVHGTFDVVDLISIVVAGILPMAFTVKHNRNITGKLLHKLHPYHQNIST